MPAPTRRRALHGAAALLAGLAGCFDESSSTGTRATRRSGDVAYDPESFALRNPSPGPTVWTGQRPTAEPGDDRVYFPGHLFVAGPDDLADVSVADVPGAADARAFLEATDYDAATVYVDQSFVGECYEPELCHVRWSETEIRTSYARRYRDVDVACEADAEDFVTNLIRIPVALDPDKVRSYSSSGGGRCRTPTDESMAAEEGQA